MLDYLDALRADHAKIHDLLAKISEKQDAFDHGQGDDYLVLCRAVGSLSDFLMHDHHPKEEALLDSLVTYDPRIAQPANALLREHRFCEHQIESLIEMLDSKSLQGRGDHVRIISALTMHLPMFVEVEETFLYPMLEQIPDLDESLLSQLGEFQDAPEEV